jgi:hypothetical protein
MDREVLLARVIRLVGLFIAWGVWIYIHRAFFAQLFRSNEYSSPARSYKGGTVAQKVELPR